MQYDQSYPVPLLVLDEYNDHRCVEYAKSIAKSEEELECMLRFLNGYCRFKHSDNEESAFSLKKRRERTLKYVDWLQSKIDSLPANDHKAHKYDNEIRGYIRNMPDC